MIVYHLFIFSFINNIDLLLPNTLIGNAKVFHNVFGLNIQILVVVVRL